MDLDANELELTSSESSENLDAAVNADNAIDSTTSDSSTENGATSDDTLSVVRDVVTESRKGTEEAASPAEKAEEPGEKPDENAQKKEPDNENFSDVPFHKHPRFQELLRQKKHFEVDARRYQNVQSFLDNNNLSAEEAADGLSIMALAKTNPAQAWERMKPFVQQVLQLAGEVLPDDLAQRVHSGEMSEQVALELSRNRSKALSLESSQSFRAQQEERQRQQAQQMELYNTAVDWEKDRRAKDPNFDAKYELLQKELAYIQYREGKPTTKEGVLAQLKKAYEAAIPSVQAPIAPKKPIRSMGGQIAGKTMPTKPQSTLDIIQNVVQRRNG